jgi:hypothetical protein
MKLWMYHPESDSLFQIGKNELESVKAQSNNNLAQCNLIGEVIDGTEKEVSFYLRQWSWSENEIETTISEQPKDLFQKRKGDKLMSKELMIPDASQVPAYARDPEAARIANEEASANISTGIPARIKLSGKQFALVDGNGDEKAVPLKSLVEGEDGQIYLPVIVLRAKKALSKQFFLTKYNPNEEAKAPDCWSNDAERPDPSIKTPQSDTCASCPHNAFGSGKDADGNATNGKACTDSKILAVAVPNHGVFSLKIPPASLKNFGLFVKQLSANGIPIGNIKTYVGFSTDTSYPVLIFRFGGFMPESVLPGLMKLAQSPESNEIIEGMTVTASAPALPAAPAEAPPALKEEPVKEAPPKAEAIQDDLGLGLGEAIPPAPKEELVKEAPAPAENTSSVPTDDELAAQLGL